ncbi:glycosyltransferase family 2 protein [Fontimonas sp. SYSU GA230001]|uniref:glycosyltransferase family 2 protein n=1 Tax=Fontimonas sp. SYSU GA230001 TaxID=3142450 RepID=UPI0032B34C20
MTAPRVSVVLPTYNRLRTLPRAVASVLDQDEVDLELIVVDDAGNDGSERWLAELAAREPRVRVLRHERNGGVSRARNTGIAAARGDFIAFQDSDDEWLPGRMRALMDCLTRQPPSVGAVAGGLVRHKRRGLQVCRWVAPRSDGGPQPVDFDAIARACFAHCQAMLFRRAALADIGGFDATIQAGEDWDLCLRLAQRFSIVEIAEPVTRAYASRDSLTRRRSQLTTAFGRVLARDGTRMQPATRARIHRMAAIDACIAGDRDVSRTHLAQARQLAPGDLRLRLLAAMLRLAPGLTAALASSWREMRRMAAA